MFIVISSAEYLENEVVWTELLLGQGLETFHLRKPNLAKEHFESLLKAISPEHKKKVVLHQHHELALKYNVKGLHLKEEHRRNLSEGGIKDLKKNLQKRNMLLSSSFHSLDDIKVYNGLFDYVFLSPVFKSISKPEYVSSSEFRVQGAELRKTKIIALGGIQENNVTTAKNLGFDGVAVLGAIWQEPLHALSRFETIKKEYEASFVPSSL